MEIEEEDNRAFARNPPSKGFHAPDGTRSSSTNRRYARPKRRVRKSCFFSDRKSERGSKSKKKKKKKEHDFNPIDFGETRFDPRGNRIDLSWTRFKFVQWGISRNFNNFYRVDLECRKNRTSND